ESSTRARGKRANGASEFSARFAEFWELYPRKIGKPVAERAWKKAAISETRADEILGGLRLQLPGLQAKELQFRPHASTWLNQQRWNDPVEEPELPDFAGLFDEPKH